MPHRPEGGGLAQGPEEQHAVVVHVLQVPPESR